MLFTVGTGYFLWINTNNGTYSQALAQRGTAIQDQQMEDLVLNATLGTNGNLMLLITNVGGIGVNATDLFVTVPPSLIPPSPLTNVYPCPLATLVGNECSFGLGLTLNTASPNLLPIVISAGVNSPAIDTTVPVPAGTPPPALTYLIKVLTQRGNTFGTTFSPEVRSVSTRLQPSSIVAVGSSVNDSAFLTGVTSTAGGTVQYEYFASNDCSGSQNLVGGPVTVTNGGVPNSVSRTFNIAGVYSWDAIYTGDANNAGTFTSPCEPLRVQATPTLFTSLSSQVVPVGGLVSDSATISGLRPGATGYVSYYYSNVDSCPETGAFRAGVSQVMNGVVSPSTQISFPSAGTFYWYAVYSGDTYNAEAASPCEPLAVGSFPKITTNLPATSIALSGSTTDSATLTGAASNPGGGATISFWWSFINTCPTNGATEVSSVPVSNSENGLYQSNPSRPFNTPGVYYWYATYSGDNLNAGITSPCEPLTVGLAITTTLSAGTITAGGSVTDYSILHFATPTAGGSVTYQYFDGSDCSGSPIPLNIVTVTNGVVPKSASQTFNIAGSYSWDAIYTGDTNNVGPVTSPCEPLTVLPISNGGSGGSLGLVSESFRFYYTNCNPEGNSGSCPPGTGDGVSVGGYYGYGLSFNPLPTCTGFLGCLFGTVPTAQPNVYQIQVTNTDPSRSITLSAQSFILIQGTCSVSFLCSFLSSGFSQGYFIISGVTGNNGHGAVPHPYSSPVVIPPGVQATLYFYCPGGPCTTAVPSTSNSYNSPPAGASLVVSLGLFGLYTDGTPFAQTIPYVASYVSPVYISAVSPSQPVGSLWLTGAPGSTIQLTAANFPTQPSRVDVYWTNPDGTTCDVTSGNPTCAPNPSPPAPSCSGTTTFTCTVSFTIPNTAQPGQFYGIYVTSDGVNNAYATVGITGASTTSVICTPSSVKIGGTSSCQATVTGVSPTGTITWSQSPSGIVSFAPTTCTLSGGACSVTVTGTAPGSTSIAGTYSGDNNNQGSQGTFPFTVNLASPTISTTLSSSNIPVGQHETDSATLTGASPTAGGTVQYEYFASNTCSGMATNVGTAVTVTNGIVPNSPAQTFNSPGSYGWEAVYSGDTNNAGTTSACEPLSVTTSTLTIAPIQGPTGTRTTLSGTGYALTFAYSDCLSLSSVTVSCVLGSGSTFTSSAAGAIPAGTTVTVPAATSQGSYFVIVYTGGAVVTFAPFTVTSPAVVLSPTQGMVGKSVTVTGSGFSVNTLVGTFTFNGVTPGTQTCTSQTTSATGTFSCTFGVPSSTSGAKTVVASGNDVGTVAGDTASATFTVTTPAITLSPAQGPKGVTVTVTGSGFTQNTPINTFTFGGTPPGTQSCTSQTTTPTGAFTCTFVVPPNTAGGYTAVATGSDGGSDTASATFTITTPSIVLSPNTGHVGASVTVSGSGFSVNTAIGSITMVGGTISTQTCTSQVASGTGTFSCTFTVPSDSVGSHAVTVSGSDIGTVTADTASQAFTVTITHGFVQQVPSSGGGTFSANSFTCTLPGVNTGDVITVGFTITSGPSVTSGFPSGTRGDTSYTRIGTSTDLGAISGTVTNYLYAGTVTNPGSDIVTVRFSSAPTAGVFTCIEWSGVTLPAVTSTTNSGTTTSSPNSVFVTSFAPNSGDLVYAYVGYTSCRATNTITYDPAYTNGNGEGIDSSIGSICHSTGTQRNAVLNEADEYVTSWGSGSTQATFGIPFSSTPDRSVGWAEIVVEFDPPIQIPSFRGSSFLMQSPGASPQSALIGVAGIAMMTCLNVLKFSPDKAPGTGSATPRGKVIS
jgi:hypothetical protein